MSLLRMKIFLEKNDNALKEEDKGGDMGGLRRAWTGRWVSLLQSLNEAPAPAPEPQ